LEVTTIGQKKNYRSLELEICGIKRQTKSPLVEASFNLDGSRSPKKITSDTLISYFLENSEYCKIMSIEILRASDIVSELDIIRNTVGLHDLRNFLAISPNGFLKFDGDLKLVTNHQTLEDLEIGQSIVTYLYVKVNQMGEQFSIQPLKLTIKKTFNAVPKFIGSFSEYSKLSVTVSQFDLLNGNDDPLRIGLPIANDFEGNPITFELEAPDLEEWISLVDNEGGKALQIDPLKVTSYDDGKHNFVIYVHDDKTSAKNSYDVQIDLIYIPFDVVAAHQNLYREETHQDLLAKRGQPDFSALIPRLRIKNFDVTHRLNITFDQNMFVDKNLNYSAALEFSVVSGLDGKPTVGMYKSLDFFGAENLTRLLV
jgi:hypothetical protein